MSSISSICVYCGSSNDAPAAHMEAATRLGTLMADRGISLVYGGGRVGLMGKVAKGVIDAGGSVVGIIPDFLDAIEEGFRQVSELHVVPSMHERKMMMFERSDAFLVLPGGIGTLDETFEIVTWRQLKLHDLPIVLVNVDGYWDPLLGLFDHMIGARYARPGTRDLFQVVNGVEEALDLLATAPAPAVEGHEERM